jgi:hypothetical protein
LALGVCLYNAHYTLAQTDQTASKLQAANAAVNLAFNTVLDAEKAGANTTDLLTQLNKAQDILAQAENSYRTGDNNTATAKADSVLPIAQEVTIAAQNAKQTATASAPNRYWFPIALTEIATIIFIIALFLIWRQFKQHYISKLREAKPEATNP